MSTRSTGLAAERVAHEILRRAGYRLVATNVRTRFWELDVIAWDHDTLCFIEVRSTRTLRYGGPFASVRYKKQQQILRGATHWIAEHALPPPLIRFDVLGLWGAPPRQQFQLIRGAFVA